MKYKNNIIGNLGRDILYIRGHLKNRKNHKLNNVFIDKYIIINFKERIIK